MVYVFCSSEQDRGHSLDNCLSDSFLSQTVHHSSSTTAAFSVYGLLRSTFLPFPFLCLDIQWKKKNIKKNQNVYKSVDMSDWKRLKYLIFMESIFFALKTSKLFQYSRMKIFKGWGLSCLCFVFFFFYFTEKKYKLLSPDLTSS